MAAVNAQKEAVLRLYRDMLHTGRCFKSYNFREYALRRTKEEFRKHKDVADAEEITRLYNTGVQNLNMLQRQATVNQIYAAPDRLVVEH